MRIATRAVHAGERLAPDGWKPVTTPIYPSVAYLYDDFASLDRVAGGEQAGYMYSRYAHPTGRALELAVVALESGEDGAAAAPLAAVSFASGMAALHAAVLASGLRAGDAALCSRDLYGATIGLMRNVLEPLGVAVHVAPLLQPAAWPELFAAARPRLVIVETLSNPLLRMPDLSALSAAAHAAGARLLVDSTFATPLLCRPLALGADFVVHSATKYLAGHGDVIGGLALAREPEAAALELQRKLVGGCLGPFEAWLILRGLKTLPLRFERQCHNALALAEFLAAQPAVERVHYPGLDSHPDHALARRQFPAGLFGAMLSLELRGAGRAEVFRFLNALRLFLPATSLGDVQSLALYPVSSSHRDLSPKQRRETGIGENLLRLSCGIEAVEDLREDLACALAAIAG